MTGFGREWGMRVAAGVLTMWLSSGLAMGQGLDDPLLAEGKLLFEETAGGIGCAACHGMAGTGDADAGAPYIRGISDAAFKSALNGAVPVMETMVLTPNERKAVFAYLQYLGRAPESQLDPSALAGKTIFEETAGGVGCKTCHGVDGHGDVGPDITGKDPVAIFEALMGVEEMGFIELSEDDVQHVADYLRHLHDAEAH